MKNPFRSNLLPIFPAAAGILGLLLRIWLFSAIDERGLLPAKHIADTGLFLLTALTLSVVFLATRNLETCPLSKGFLRLSGIAGCALGGAGLCCAGFDLFSHGSARFSHISAFICIVGGLVLLSMAVLRFLRKRIPFGFPAVLTVCLMVNTVVQCQVWGSSPQLQEYFFPLIASVFLVLSAYHTTYQAADQPKPNSLAFFSQSAVFFCCVCLNDAQWPLYLGLLFWAAAQLYPCVYETKEA